jgi:hypothetical protein
MGGRRESLVVFLTSPIFRYIHNPGWAAFTFSVSIAAFCFLPVWVLYRKRIFLKV